MHGITKPCFKSQRPYCSKACNRKRGEMREIVGQQWHRHLTPGSNPIPRTTMVSLEEGFASGLSVHVFGGCCFR